MQASCGQGRGARPEGWRPDRPSEGEITALHTTEHRGAKTSPAGNRQGARARSRNQGSDTPTPGTPQNNEALSAPVGTEN